MRIKRAIVASAKTIVALCVLFVFILIICVGVLFFGVSFDKLDFSQFEVRGVELAVNPKIVLSIDELILRDQGDESVESDESDPKAALRKIKAAFFALMLTDRLEVKRVDINGTQTRILYENDEFNLSSQKGYARFTLGWVEGAGAAFELIDSQYADLELSVRGNGFISPITGRFTIDARYKSPYISGVLSAWGDDKRALLRVNRTRINFEEYEGELWGLAEVDLQTKKGSFEGGAQALDIRGALRVNYEGDLVSFTLLGAEAQSLKRLAEILPLDPIAKEWIHGNVVAESFKANRFALDLNLTTMTPNIAALFLDAQAQNAEISFNPALPSAHAKEVRVAINKGALTIASDDADYEGQKADAKVVIDRLDSKRAQTLTLNIDTAALFNQSMRDLLAAYGVNVALVQTSGENRANFELKLPLSNADDMHFKARLATSNGELNMSDAPIKYREAQIAIDDSNITIERFDAIIDGIRSASIGGLIEASEQRFAFDLDVRGANILGGKAARFRRLKTRLIGEWDDNKTLLKLDDFATELSLSGDRLEVKANDLKLYKPYMPSMELLDIKGGKLKLVKENGGAIADFTIDMGAKIIYKDKKPVENASGRFRLDKDGSYSLKLLDGAFVAEMNKDFVRVTINGLEIDASEIIDFAQRRKAAFSAEELSEGGGDRPLFVFGDKSGVRFKGRLFKSDWFSFYREGDRFEGKIKNANAVMTINRDRSDITFRGENIGSDWVKDLSGVKMSGGKWDFSAYASLNSEDVYGVIRIRDATIREAKLFTNVVALINALPSLAQFRSPGFTSKGFKINDGVVELYYSSGVLYFNAARFTGINTDILAQGSVNINSGEADIYAAVQSVKSLSSFLSKVPIVGYLLMGDSGKFENILHITGAIDNPKVKTALAKEFVFYPVNVLRRTLTLPVKLFE
ncbi:MAG: AsmA-like C-terminal domain-containing protein [Helicobacteraceae bacterium]|jgi:hypothetical protein|nr:AsmA-like C-terminal domain-containing protein [Helicobacteraceae bacterium]